LRQAPLGNLKESSMSIKIGDKIRYSVTNEEGAVVAISNNTSCAAVQFGNSFAYLVATKELELEQIPVEFTHNRRA
jgi:dsDNA-specific endonuclease/ATPase MutS2